jgi:hypothetical protein
VLFAFMVIPWKDRLDTWKNWASDHNPFYDGPWSDILGLLPFITLSVLLYLVGRDVLLGTKSKRTRS